MVRAIEASGAEVVTVAVRRVNLDRSKESSVLHFLDPKKIFLLANTAGCYTAADAIRYARLAREAGFNDFVKRSEEHTSELQSQSNLVCRLLLEKKKGRISSPLFIHYSLTTPQAISIAYL